MKTVSVNVMNLCVPCHCHCRYCLLSWNGSVTGVEYDRSERYAKRFYDWMQAQHPELFFSFYFGYSMEHPNLLQSIDFMRSMGSPGGEFLQFDGMKIRTLQETDALLRDLKAHGIRLIDLTFYGTREYHDRFAGRGGDFDFMQTVLERAERTGLSVQVGIPLTQENVSQANELYKLFSGHSLQRFYYFVPHTEGRGATLEPIRLCTEDLAKIHAPALAHFNQTLYHTPTEWLEMLPTLEPWEKRTVTIALTPETMDTLEGEPFADTIARVESLDDAYHAALPSFEALLRTYADVRDTHLYSRRDLTQSLQRRYIREHGLSLYDVHDERQSFIRRH